MRFTFAEAATPVAAAVVELENNCATASIQRYERSSEFVANLRILNPTSETNDDHKEQTQSSENSVISQNKHLAWARQNTGQMQTMLFKYAKAA